MSPSDAEAAAESTLFKLVPRYATEEDTISMQAHFMQISSVRHPAFLHVSKPCADTSSSATATATAASSARRGSSILGNDADASSARRGSDPSFVRRGSDPSFVGLAGGGGGGEMRRDASEVSGSTMAHETDTFAIRPVGRPVLRDLVYVYMYMCIHIRIYKCICICRWVGP